MNIRTVTVDRLTGDDIAAWAAIQQGNPALDSPYFHPAFTLAVGAERNDVEVAVMTEAGERVGFFPYQRTRLNSARPVGGGLSDFHGLIARRGLAFDPVELLRRCHLASWDFNRLVAAQEPFAPFVWRSDESPYTELSDDYESRAARQHRMVRDAPRRARAIERHYGALRFEPHVADRAVFSALMRLKSDQYDRTRQNNVFAFSWVRKLLEGLLRLKGEDFSPLMSVLYAGDDLAAICYGLRSRHVLHIWFPVYNREMARFSPGTLSYLKLFQAARALGITRIDWGKGPERFKQGFMTGATPLAEGTVDAQSGRAIIRRSWRQAKDFVRSSRLYPTARVPAQMLYQFRSWLALR